MDESPSKSSHPKRPRLPVSTLRFLNTEMIRQLFRLNQSILEKNRAVNNEAIARRAIEELKMRCAREVRAHPELLGEMNGETED